MHCRSGWTDCGESYFRRSAAMKGVVYLAVLATTLCAVTSAGWAQQSASEMMGELTEAQEARVIELIDDGQEAYEEGDLRQSLRYFNEVYVPVVLFREVFGPPVYKS